MAESKKEKGGIVCGKSPPLGEIWRTKLLTEVYSGLVLEIVILLRAQS
jgi:hypothetical protein